MVGSYLISLAVFLFGLVAGSFVNSLVYRLNEGGPIFSITSRSFCPHCRHTLSWRDLVPLVSFIVLHGKCRYCGQSIGWYYPAGEFACALIFLGTWKGIEGFVFGVSLIPYAILAVSLSAIFVSDLRYFTIPDIFVIILFCAGILLFLFSLPPYGEPLPKGFLTEGMSAIMREGRLVGALAGSFFGALFFWIFVFVSKERWMGWGDVKFGIPMGFLVGFPYVIIALFLAFTLGAFVGLALLAWRKKHLQSELPLGVFLVPSTLVMMFWSQDVCRFLQLCF